MDVVISVDKIDELFAHDVTGTGSHGGKDFRILHTRPGRSLIVDLGKDKYLVDMTEIVLRIMEQLDETKDTP